MNCLDAKSVLARIQTARSSVAHRLVARAIGLKSYVTQLIQGSGTAHIETESRVQTNKPSLPWQAYL